ncbi:MAG TPA: hypothetical protein VHT75_09465 [Acidimicrobiales bacterium]|jgi:hypothetical protein|nr:hypothetical protein [Acidimicrobiales bacterium]
MIDGEDHGKDHGEDPGAAAGGEEPSILERLRGSGVGTEDPNIIGDAGPTDVAPGRDPVLPALTEELPPEVETPAERTLPSDEEADGAFFGDPEEPAGTSSGSAPPEEPATS